MGFRRILTSAVRWEQLGRAQACVRSTSKRDVMWRVWRCWEAFLLLLTRGSATLRGDFAFAGL
ncbi:hypothetical protein JZ751_004355 [Albula glossodonta]|uniref:Uncharacterized protein n=1 Tax=Albula glossodonta TaxID=121402 RepID=A0A8T2MVQ7_9TELE|nr:hypothetical protein JZ751_004355 [Albula glossodonta]